jgi:DNA gyrase/topoisomerase IV subunit A
VGLWTDNFKEYLESLSDVVVDKAGKKIQPIVKDYDDMSKDTTVDFIITLQKGKLEELESQELDHGCNGLQKQFKLFTSVSITNMHVFDANDKLKKYGKVYEMIDDYFETRLKLYDVRKKYLIDALTKELILLSNKSRYIKLKNLAEKKIKEIFNKYDINIKNLDFTNNINTILCSLNFIKDNYIKDELKQYELNIEEENKITIELFDNIKQNHCLNQDMPITDIIKSLYDFLERKLDCVSNESKFIIDIVEKFNTLKTYDDMLHYTIIDSK